MISKSMMKSALESMLFIWGQPLAAKEAAKVFDVAEKDVIECFEELIKEYEDNLRGIRIRRIEKSFQFVTPSENEIFIRELCTPVKSRKLTQAAMEVLAIIAYKQPVSKGEIDSVRGIKCDRVVEGLSQKNLVKEVGRSEAVGRPILYGTTEEFLKHFGFQSIKDLPKIEDIEDSLEFDDDSNDDNELLQITIDGME